VIHGFPIRCYGSARISRGGVARAIEHSPCFGIYHHGGQVGFASVVSDRATFAYLVDVFVLEDHRGIELPTRLLTAIVAHPDLQGLRRFLLGRRDAQGLYRQFGIGELAHPSRLMEIPRSDIYRRS
jgi:GNAT superfamily N-acetyltransferase